MQTKCSLLLDRYIRQRKSPFKKGTCLTGFVMVEICLTTQSPIITAGQVLNDHCDEAASVTES